MKYQITVIQKVEDMELTAVERESGLAGVHVVEAKDSTEALAELFGDVPRNRAFRVLSIEDLGPSTNVEFVVEIMNQSRYGMLMQGFVVERVLQACSDILENEEEVRQKMEHSLVKADAWIGCAREFKETYDKYFNAGKMSEL
jgi:hypothetical protein